MREDAYASDGETERHVNDHLLVVRLNIDVVLTVQAQLGFRRIPKVHHCPK